MKRKIVQHGSSSLTVTLPSKWASQFHIQKGDEVDITEAGTQLIVTTKKESSPAKIVINGNKEKFTRNTLSHLYQLGYDEIQIENASNEIFKELKERLPQCLGFEIVNQKAGKIEIKSIAVALEEEFDTLLRKAFMVTEDMGQELLSALEKRQWEKLEEIRNLEALNNKFTDICIRILNKRGYAKNPSRTMQMYEVLKNLERVADEFKYLCDICSKERKAPDKSLISLMREAVAYVSGFRKLFYEHTPLLEDELISKRKSLIESIQESSGKTRYQNLFTHHLANVVQKTYEGIGGYHALVL